MISFTDFINKYNGKGIDFDNWYGDQCVDLMNQYMLEVLGISNPSQVLPGGTAYQIYQNAKDPRFIKIDNTPTGVPKNGDILFFKPNITGVTGPAGHVSVFISGDTNNILSFDQNYPTGSLCHEQKHTYVAVAGWLHYQGGGSVANMYKGLDLSNPESMKVAVDIWDAVVNQHLYVKKSDIDTSAQTKLNQVKSIVNG